MALKLALLALAWVAWCVLHSTLISPGVTARVNKRWGPHFAYFRMVFNLISLGTLIPVVLYASSLRTDPIVHWGWPYSVVKYVLWLTCALVFILTARCYDMLSFLGLRQVLTLRSKCLALPADRLVTNGPLGVVRHPWYAAGLLLLWARDLYATTLVTNVVLSTYLIIGSYLEERKLLLTFGEAYRNYQQEVSMLFPIKWLQRRFKVSTTVGFSKDRPCLTR